MIAIFWVAGKAGARIISECASSFGGQPSKAIVGNSIGSWPCLPQRPVNFAKLSVSRVAVGDIALARSLRADSSSASVVAGANQRLDCSLFMPDGRCFFLGCMHAYPLFCWDDLLLCTR